MKNILPTVALTVDQEFLRKRRGSAASTSNLVPIVPLKKLKHDHIKQTLKRTKVVSTPVKKSAIGSRAKDKSESRCKRYIGDEETANIVSKKPKMSELNVRLKLAPKSTGRKLVNRARNTVVKLVKKKREMATRSVTAAAKQQRAAEERERTDREERRMVIKERRQAHNKGVSPERRKPGRPAKSKIDGDDEEDDDEVIINVKPERCRSVIKADKALIPKGSRPERSPETRSQKAKAAAAELEAAQAASAQTEREAEMKAASDKKLETEQSGQKRQVAKKSAVKLPINRSLSPRKSPVKTLTSTLKVSSMKMTSRSAMSKLKDAKDAGKHSNGKPIPKLTMITKTVSKDKHHVTKETFGRTNLKNSSARPVAREIVGRTTPKDCSARPVAKETVGRTTPKDCSARPVAKETVGRTTPKDCSARPVSKEIVGRTTPKDCSARPVAKETVGRTTPKDSSARPIAKEIVSRTTPKDCSARPVAKETVGRTTPKNSSARPVVKESKDAVSKETISKQPLVSRQVAKQTVAKEIMAVKQAAKETAAKPPTCKPTSREAVSTSKPVVLTVPKPFTVKDISKQTITREVTAKEAALKTKADLALTIKMKPKPGVPSASGNLSPSVVRRLPGAVPAVRKRTSSSTTQDSDSESVCSRRSLSRVSKYKLYIL